MSEYEDGLTAAAARLLRRRAPPGTPDGHVPL